MCTELRLPFWAPEGDHDAAEDPSLIDERQPDHWMPRLMQRMFAGPGHKVDRVIREGEEVAGFQVLHTPGHSAGHVSFWRESDGVLIAGDVLNSAHPFMPLITGLREPYEFFSPDPAENRRSIKRLAALEPSLALFGHGPPVRDPRKLAEFASTLP